MIEKKNSKRQVRYIKCEKMEILRDPVIEKRDRGKYLRKKWYQVSFNFSPHLTRKYRRVRVFFLPYPESRSLS